MYQVGLGTNQSGKIGEKGFVYDIYRKRTGESESKSATGSLYIMTASGNVCLVDDWIGAYSVK